VHAEAQLALGDAAGALQTARQAAQIAEALQADNRHSARTGQALVLQAMAQARIGNSAAARALGRQALQHLEATVQAQQRWRVLAGQLAAR
jgi:hypothetical protein